MCLLVYNMNDFNFKIRVQYEALWTQLDNKKLNIYKFSSYFSRFSMIFGFF